MVSQPTVDIYHSKVRGLRAKAIEFPHRRGGPVDFAPQTFIGDRHVGGWRKLEAMIKSGEIDALLPEGG